MIDASVKSVQEFRLVPRCGQWCRTRGPDLLFKLHGLVDRLPAGESRDKLPAVVRVLGAWRDRSGGGENLAEIRLHHLLPTGAQEGQGSVEVEQSVANAPRHYLDVIEDPNGCTDRLRGESSSRTSATVTVQGAARKPAQSATGRLDQKLVMPYFPTP